MILRVRCLTFAAAGKDCAAFMANIPTQFTGVTAVTKANVYFDGKVVTTGGRRLRPIWDLELGIWGSEF